MNGAINILKLIFAFTIVMVHCGTFFGYENFGWFQGAFIYVEWFYIFAGYTLARKVMRMERKLPLCETTAGLLKQRILALLPYYWLSCCIALVLKMSTGLIEIDDPWKIHWVVFDLLMLNMTTLPAMPLTDVAWFLSSMWLALILLTPLLLLFRHRFARFAILITAMLYYYIYRRTGHLYGPVEWLPLSYKGNLRAVGAICLGFTGYELGEWLRQRWKRTRRQEVVVLLIYAVILAYTFFWEESLTTNKIYFILPFVFLVLIAVQMSGKGPQLLPDNRFTRFMGQFSMVLYMNHAYLIRVVSNSFPDMFIARKVPLSVALSVAVALAVYFAGGFLAALPAWLRRQREVSAQ